MVVFCKWRYVLIFSKQKARGNM
uniref:Uncharacterized protein n=1 Tax=Anguilla anguilla TaxID=7936 RepID=A0A0E9PDQ5_ANGAN